jgi:hypothetical protein
LINSETNPLGWHGANFEGVSLSSGIVPTSRPLTGRERRWTQRIVHRNPRLARASGPSTYVAVLKVADQLVRLLAHDAAPTDVARHALE